MYYIAGYTLKTAGPFVAKEQFEGFTNDVTVTDGGYIVQGQHLTTEQVQTCVETSATVESLSIRNRTVCNEPLQGNRALKEFDRQFSLQHEGLRYSIYKNGKTKSVPYIDLETIELDVKFLRALLAKASVVDTVTQRDIMNRLRSLYVQEFAKAINAPKFPKVKKQK